MHSRRLQATVVFSLLVCGVLVSATIGNGTSAPDFPPVSPSALDAPVLSIQRRPGRLDIKGTTASSAHEDGLMQIIADQYADTDSQTNFQPGVVLAGQWEPASMRLLYALAVTASAQATMHEDRIEIHGVTSDPGPLASRLELLRDSVGQGVTIDQDFIVLNDSATLDDLCERNLSHALTEPVRFRQSSTEIRSASLAVLDKIIELANDCRDSAIAITGHSDASGDETWNQLLSVARAQAVANYITRGGIAAARLQVEGRGSAVPVADNATALGRSMNRRIEFELRPAYSESPGPIRPNNSISNTSVAPGGMTLPAPRSP